MSTHHVFPLGLLVVDFHVFSSGVPGFHASPVSRWALRCLVFRFSIGTPPCQPSSLFRWGSSWSTFIFFFSAGAPRGRPSLVSPMAGACWPSSVSHWGSSLSTFLRFVAGGVALSTFLHFNWGNSLSTLLPCPLGLLCVNLPNVATLAPRCQPTSFFKLGW